MYPIRDYLPLAGRILLSAIFILSGFNKIVAWSDTAGYMASKGMPLIPFFLTAAILVEIVGGLSLLFAWRPRWGAWLLFLYLIPTTLIFHNFWALTGAVGMNEMIHFMKNLTIMGGLLIVAAVPERAVRAGLRKDELVTDLDTRRVA